MSEEVKSGSEQKKEDWMNSKWRPMMGWMYMVVCTMDMVVFPVLWSLLQTFTHQPVTQWNPLTLQGAGLFHIAMGAVLGLAAWGRTQEKLGGANNGGLSTPTTGVSVPASTPSSFQAPAQASFGTPSSPGGFSGGGFGGVSSAPAASSGFGGAPAPIATTASGKKIVPDDPQPVI